MECKNLYCPWVQNSHDADHYVCLKCGKERRINNYELGDGFWWVLAVIVIIIVGFGNHNSQEKLPPNKVNIPSQSRINK